MITPDDLAAVSRGLSDIRIERSRLGAAVGAAADGEQRGMTWAWLVVCALAGQIEPHVALHRLRTTVACVDVLICLRCGAEHCPVDGACNWRRETWDFVPGWAREIPTRRPGTQ